MRFRFRGKPESCIYTGMRSPQFGIDGITVDGIRVPFRSAGCRYWEQDPALWPRVLDALVELRIPVLRVDLAWAEHEVARGIYDWGESRPRCDIATLIELARARGLWLLIRPKLTVSALPKRVLHLADVSAMDATGRVWPRPSLVSQKFHDEARDWLMAARRFIDRVQFPQGPVLGWIVDSGFEVPSPWGAGSLDHSKSGLEFFAEFLDLKYPVDSGELADTEREAAWIEAGQTAQRLSIEQFRESLPPAQSISVVRDWPLGSGVQGYELDGLRMFHVPDSIGNDFDSMRLIGLRAESFAVATQVSSDCNAESAALLAMGGCRGIDLERAPIEPERSDSSADAAWLTLMKALDAIHYDTLTRRSDFAVLENREYAHLRESRSCTGLLPQDFGSVRMLEALRIAPRLTDATDEAEYDIQHRAWIDLFRAAGFSFSLDDSSCLSMDSVPHSVLFLLTLGRMSRELMSRVLSHVSHGGTILIGPVFPTHDWSGAPLDLPIPEAVDATVAYGRGRILRVGSFCPWRFNAAELPRRVTEVKQLLARADLDPCYPTSDPAVETELHYDEERSFLFVANASVEVKEVEIALEPNEALREVRGLGRHIRAGDRLTVPGRSVVIRERVRL